MCEEFVEFQEYLKRLKSIYFSALSSFYVFEAIEKLKAPNIAGEKEAKNNVEVINRFKDFFVTSRHALNFHFLMELAKLIDDAKQSLHLEKLINFAEQNNKKLSASNFNNANQDREFLQDLTARFEGLQKNDLEKIKKLLQSNESIIQKLKTYRDQYLAHEDKNKKKISLTVEEIQTLFSIIEKTLNIFSDKTNFSTTSYDHVKTYCEQDTKNVIEYLKRFEIYRLREIKERFDVDGSQFTP